MKYLLLITLSVVFVSCDNTTTTTITHELVVTPKTLTYAPGVSVQTLSITHTCTCPFTWDANPLDTSGILQHAHGIWDSTQVQIRIDRSKLTKDTLHASLEIASNAYGRDTVQVTVLK